MLVGTGDGPEGGEMQVAIKVLKMQWRMAGVRKTQRALSEDSCTRGGQPTRLRFQVG